MTTDGWLHKVNLETTAHIKCCRCGMWWHIPYAVYLLLEIAICPMCGEARPLEQKKEL